MILVLFFDRDWQISRRALVSHFRGRVTPKISAGGVLYTSTNNYWRQYYDMALSSGIYTIENAKNSNWAMLLDGHDKGEVVAGSSASPNVGEKVSRLKANMKLTAKLNQALPVVYQATGERNLYSTE